MIATSWESRQSRRARACEGNLVKAAVLSIEHIGTCERVSDESKAGLRRSTCNRCAKTTWSQLQSSPLTLHMQDPTITLLHALISRMVH